MTKLLKPVSPFVFSLPGSQIHPGQSITVLGEPNLNCNRFSINLVKQQTLRNIFHFDTRFDQGQTVRNCNYPSGTWGPEELNPLTLTLVKGRNFFIEFKCKNDRITVLVDGAFHCDFMQRAPLMEADTLQILGEVKIHQVQFK